VEIALSEMSTQFYNFLSRFITGMIYIRTVVKTVKVGNVDIGLGMVNGRLTALFPPSMGFKEVHRDRKFREKRQYLFSFFMLVLSYTNIYRTSLNTTQGGNNVVNLPLCHHQPYVYIAYFNCFNYRYVNLTRNVT